MFKITPALFKWALLLCVIAAETDTAFAQAAAKPAPAPTPAQTKVRVKQTVVDSTIPDDPAVNEMLEAYSPKVRALDLNIGKLKGDLRKGGIGAGSMGNFVADGLRAQASLKLGKPILLAVNNAGGLRKNTISEGDLRVRDIFELLPFENALMAFDLTGEQVIDLLRTVVAKRDAQSGARISYKINADKRPELISAKFLIDGVEKDIDPAATYTVVSIDYLLRVTGGDYAPVLKNAMNQHELGLTMREAMLTYVKSETAAGREIKGAFDGRFVFDKDASAFKEEPTVP